MTLKEVLVHPWLTQEEELFKRRKEATKEEAFKLFSLPQPLESKICQEISQQLIIAEEKK